MVVKPKFVYFDMGNVLLRFSHERACRQIAEVVRAAGTACEAADIRTLVFDSGLELDYEAGKITTEEFYEHICRHTGARPKLADVALAASEIFDVNTSLTPVLGALLLARQPLGVLSNTNEIHWRYVAEEGRFKCISEAFSVHALSFRIGAVKPEPRIFAAAAQLAGVAPEEIFFTDDTPGHVDAARQAGFDAVPYTTADALAHELRRRGVRFNL